MSDTVIRVENLGKKYILGHQREERYTTLRDSLSAGAKGLLKPFQRVKSPGSNPSSEEFWALNDVSFEIKQGDRVGIIGRNGAGKSTLLKILSRITEPTKGSIRIKGRVASLLEVGTGFHPELTGRENISLNGAILGMSKIDIDRKFDEIVAFAEVEKFLDTPVKRYSSGMYVRLAFSVAAHLEPEILIVDEVLAVGDAQFQKKCLGKMEDVGREGRTVIFVSHNMATIGNLCNTAIFLHHGKSDLLESVDSAISKYLGGAAFDEVIFENAPIKTAYAKQVNDCIEIGAFYTTTESLRLPCLGFVISDSMGHPICGSNPALSGEKYISEYPKEGFIKVVFKEPKLLNGVYRISLWFGNGKKDFWSSVDCINFEVINMIKTKQQPTAVVGHVHPECLWTFE
jgi:lipopolysaccharide transport system ATP-binding protein